MQRMHPDGMAALIAVICATDEAGDPLGEPAYSNTVNRINEEVLGMAAQYYRIYPCDFDRGTDWKAAAMRNGLNNRAHLNRANLRGKDVH